MFTLEFISGFFKTKNLVLTEEKRKAALLKAVKVMTIPDSADIPQEAGVKIKTYADTLDEPYKNKPNLKALPTTLKAEVAKDDFDLTKAGYHLMILIVASLSKGEVENIMMTALMALSKAGSGSKRFVDNKNSTFKKSWKWELLLQEDVDPSSQETLFLCLEHKISTGVLDNELFLNHSAALLEMSTNVAVKPLLDQVALGKMTTIHAVGRALIQFSDFPWGPLATRLQIIKTELRTYKQIA